MSRPVRRSLGGGQAATVAGLVKSTHLKPGDTRSANGYPRPNGSRSPHFATLGRALAPEILEPVRLQLGVPDGVLNVLVPKIGLQRLRVFAVVRQLVAARVAQHVRVRLKGEPGRLAGTLDKLGSLGFGVGTSAYVRPNVARLSAAARKCRLLLTLMWIDTHARAA
jgi:hypothetical protein